MTKKLFEAALGITPPWSVSTIEFDPDARTLTPKIDFTPGTRFGLSGVAGEHPVRDTVLTPYRHLNFYQHECFLKVRTPRVRLLEGGVRLVELPWAGHPWGFTLLFEALLVALAQQMPFRGVARLTGLSVHRVMAVHTGYVERARGHDYITLSANAKGQSVIGVTEGRDAAAISRPAEDLRTHGDDPDPIESITINMSSA